MVKIVHAQTVLTEEELEA
ncbi:DUF5371 family protein, partial [Methanomethylovorans sp. PtaU1.Bin093]